MKTPRTIKSPRLIAALALTTSLTAACSSQTKGNADNGNLTVPVPGASGPVTTVSTAVNAPAASAETFSGEIPGPDTVAQQQITLAAGEALRVRTTTSDTLEAQLAILGDAAQFYLNADGYIDAGDIATLYTDIGYPGLGGLYLTDEMSPLAGQLNAPPILGSMQLQFNDASNDHVVVTESWLVFVAPTAGTYTLAVYAPDGEAATGTFTLTMERQLLPADVAVPFDPSQPLGPVTYKEVLIKHQPFLQDPTFFPPESFYFMGDGTACPSNAAACVPNDGTLRYFGPIPGF